MPVKSSHASLSARNAFLSAAKRSPFVDVATATSPRASRFSPDNKAISGKKGGE